MFAMQSSYENCELVLKFEFKVAFKFWLGISDGFHSDSWVKSVSSDGAMFFLEINKNSFNLINFCELLLPSSVVDS